MTILMHVMHSYDAYEKGGRLCTLQVPMTARCMCSGVGRCLILGWGGGANVFSEIYMYNTRIPGFFYACKAQ